ncbi:MAG: maleylpyruvate isomerase N-terminal domain-containing protein [Acidobacteriota bacterium]|nr:MAG: maleylpyruvate isomerase N-terminal domain-containing protein [Acidobacteriota bacterium]
MEPVTPINLTGLFCELHDELIALLVGLSDDDWRRPTAAGSWTVRDVAAHLLDSDVRRLSFQRDRLPLLEPDGEITGYNDLVGFLNRLNADWVRAARRLSPRVLTDFLRLTGPQVCELFKSLDPDAESIFSVAWAGEERSANWFDIAREYTEKWHHQQQIREAAGKPCLTARKWLHPVIDTFFRGLPHAFRKARANDGTCIVFEITGEAGGTWALLRENDAWRLMHGEPDEAAACHVQTDQDTAWRLLTKGLPRHEAAAKTRLSGDEELGEPFLDMLAIMG